MLTVEEAKAQDDREDDLEKADVNSDQEDGVATCEADGTLNLDEAEQNGTESKKS